MNNFTERFQIIFEIVYKQREYNNFKRHKKLKIVHFYEMKQSYQHDKFVFLFFQALKT